MGLKVTTGTYVPPTSETITELKGNKYDRNTYTRAWWQGESPRFEAEDNEEGIVRVCSVEDRKPKDESTSSTKATWFIQPLNWMTQGTFTILRQPLGVVNIDTVAKQFSLLDLEEMDGWEDRAKSDLATCAKYSWSDDVKWESDSSTGMYRACVSLKWLEKEDGDLITHVPTKHCWTVYSDWTVGNSLEIVQGPIMNKVKDDLKDFYRGMTIASKA
mgnify:CR=1 FL=1